jgi:hypothetical protein
VLLSESLDKSGSNRRKHQSAARLTDRSESSVSEALKCQEADATTVQDTITDSGRGRITQVSKIAFSSMVKLLNRVNGQPAPKITAAQRTKKSARDTPSITTFPDTRNDEELRLVKSRSRVVSSTRIPSANSLKASVAALPKIEVIESLI